MSDQEITAEALLIAGFAIVLTAYSGVFDRPTPEDHPKHDGPRQVTDSADFRCPPRRTQPDEPIQR